MQKSTLVLGFVFIAMTSSVLAQNRQRRQSIKSVSIECGRVDESQPRTVPQGQSGRNQRIISLSIEGNPVFRVTSSTDGKRRVYEPRSIVDAVSEVRTNPSDRSWSVFFEGHHDGDAVRIASLPPNQIPDIYRVFDLPKERNGRWVRRVIDFYGLKECLSRQTGGYYKTAYAKYYTVLSDKNGGLYQNLTPNIRPVDGCKCEMEVDDEN